VRALLEQNKPFTSIRLAFLSCPLVLAVKMHFANDVDSGPIDNLLKKQSARKPIGDEAEEQVIPAQRNWESQRIFCNSNTSVCDRIQA